MDEKIVPVSEYIANIEKYAVPQAISILGTIGKTWIADEDYFFILQDNETNKGLLCRIKSGAKMPTSQPVAGDGIKIYGQLWFPLGTNTPLFAVRKFEVI